MKLSRYAEVQDLLGSDKYYRRINFSEIDCIFENKNIDYSSDEYINIFMTFSKKVS